MYIYSHSMIIPSDDNIKTCFNLYNISKQYIY